MDLVGGGMGRFVSECFAKKIGIGLFEAGSESDFTRRGGTAAERGSEASTEPDTYLGIEILHAPEISQLS